MPTCPFRSSSGSDTKSTTKSCCVKPPPPTAPLCKRSLPLKHLSIQQQFRVRHKLLLTSVLLQLIHPPPTHRPPLSHEQPPLSPAPTRTERPPPSRPRAKKTPPKIKETHLSIQKQVRVRHKLLNTPTLLQLVQELLQLFCCCCWLGTRTNCTSINSRLRQKVG
jgi:hypothetical protein